MLAAMNRSALAMEWTMYNFYNKPNIGNLEEEWKALERIKSKIWKEAYEQGLADASKLAPVRKNGVGY